MARSVRIEYGGAFYHVMARGNRREAIFVDDRDRQWFLQTLGEACAKTGWRVHAWVLMSNHYHLMLETPEANLVEGMKWLQNTVTRRFNVKHGGWGRVFGDRYKAVIVEGRSAFYYESLWDYIHLNPVRAGIIKVRHRQSVLNYRWSSLASGYALVPAKRAPWLAASAALEVLGVSDTVAGRRRLVERLDRRSVEEEMERCGVPPLPEEMDRRCSHLRRGWYWGSQSFGEQMLKLVEKGGPGQKSRGYRSAAEIKSYGLLRAQRWLEGGLAKAHLSREELSRLPGTDSRKVALARLISRNTTVGNDWLAQQLGMRSAANVSQILRLEDRKKTDRRLPKQLRAWIDSEERKLVVMF
jgi:REP element-mobilizing transposase RayT